MLNDLLSRLSIAARPDTASGDAYRPDIDGLRALAVLPVFLYHMELGFFTGGYVGVDIFFVISGYLISGILLRSNNAGKFQFKEFYGRRARRILPAFFVTVILTLAAAAVIMPPRFFAEAGESSFWAILSLSNFYFWTNSGYFDTSVINQPFLHTWSLSVEEQYYLIWPVMILALHRFGVRRLFPYITIALTIGSFALAQAYLDDHPTAVFYLLPFRFGELALGALAAWYRPQLMKAPDWLREISTIVGIALMVVPIMTYTHDTAFPGVTALVPCLGAFLICGIGASRISGAFFWWRPSIGVGLVSYSMYLLHWPVIVLYHSHYAAMPSGLAAVIILLGVTAGSYLMYRFVEQPFRGATVSAWSHAQIGFVSAISALVLTVGATVIWTQQGWPGRYGDIIADLQTLNAEQRQGRARLLRQECHVQERSMDRRDFTPCLEPAEGQYNALILGSSYAADDAAVLGRAFTQDVHWMQMTSPGCVPVPGVEQRVPACRRAVELVESAFEDGLRPDLVIISHNWTVPNLRHMQLAIDYYSQHAERVIVYGPRGKLRTDILDIAATVPNALNGARLGPEYRANDFDAVLSAARDRDWPDNVRFFDASGLIWEPDGLVLSPVEGRLAFIDEGHFAAETIMELARDMRREYQTLDGFYEALPAAQ